MSEAGVVERSAEKGTQVGSQWQVHSVLCRQLIASPHTGPCGHTHARKHTLPSCNENIIISSSGCLTIINFLVGYRRRNSSFHFSNVLIIVLSSDHFLINGLGL